MRGPGLPRGLFLIGSVVIHRAKTGLVRDRIPLGLARLMVRRGSRRVGPHDEVTEGVHRPFEAHGEAATPAPRQLVRDAARPTASLAGSAAEVNSAVTGHGGGAGCSARG